MEARLLIYHKDQWVNSIPLRDDVKTTIGRHPNCTVALEEPKISAKHCVIESRGNSFYVIDQGSTNGTYVNGTRILEKRLYNGDRIQCSDFSFQFQWFAEDAFEQTFSDSGSEKDDLVLQTGPEDENINRVGDYRILEKIGQGGIGEVYRAEHLVSKEIKAIKLLSPDAQKDNTLVQRFLREAHACIVLDHPRIIKVFEVGCFRDRPFFVMEYVQGKSLEKFLRQNGPLSPINALKIAGHISHALACAHSHNIIHRDLKPSNILMDEKTRNIKLIDLGLAKMLDQSSLTITNRLLGTPRYMAPEQMRNPNDVDLRVDIYSLGAVIYRMVTGIVPYGEIISNNRNTLLRYMYVHSPVPAEDLVDLPEDIVSLIQKAMEKKKENRFSTAKEMFEAIHNTIQVLSTLPDSH